MSSLPQSAPPVRHGRASLVLRINGEPYAVRRQPGVNRSAPRWALTKVKDGSVRSVARVNGFIACTCEDSLYRGSHCKHMRALQAVGLVGRRLKPSAAFVKPSAAAKGGA